MEDEGQDVQQADARQFVVNPAGVVELVQDQATGQVVALRINWGGIVDSRMAAVMVLDLLEQSLRSTGWRIESVMNVPALEADTPVGAPPEA